MKTKEEFWAYQYTYLMRTELSLSYVICFFVKYLKFINAKDQKIVRRVKWKTPNWTDTSLLVVLQEDNLVRIEVYINFNGFEKYCLLSMETIMDGRKKTITNYWKQNKRRIWTYQYTYLMRTELSLSYVICFCKIFKLYFRQRSENCQQSEIKNAQLNWHKPPCSFARR
jgi:hypothetical protein